TCCGISRSSATSLMVRNASGALSTRVPLLGPTPRGPMNQTRSELVFGFVGHVSAVDALLEDRRRLEHHDPARRDRNLLAGLRIAADALTLLAHHEGAE